MNSPTSLNLPMVDPLPPETKRYFDICREKLGLVPNVLCAHAFDTTLEFLAGQFNWRGLDFRRRVGPPSAVG